MFRLLFSFLFLLSQFSKAQTSRTGICWEGTINKTIPVLLYYSIENQLIAGEIIYLNIMSKTPIKILGTVDDNNTYQISEFDERGNISGVISTKVVNKTMAGTWASPASKRELEIKLSRKDTLITSPAIQANPAQIYGNYHFRYGTEGSEGHLELRKLDRQHAVFSISTTTAAPAYNEASVSNQVVKLINNGFVHKVPDSECIFKVSFFQGFAVAEYTDVNNCQVFGLNSTLEGIYLKVQK